MSVKPKRKKRGFWRVLRVYFRRFRILIWLVLLALLGCFIYLNQVGLPEFLNRPLARVLKQQGVELRYTRLRLRFYEGIVAENVQFGRSTAESAPKMSAREARVSLAWRELLTGHPQVDGFVIRGGVFRLPVMDDVRPGRELVVSNIQAELRLLARDEWVLDQLNGSLLDSRFRLSARLEHASAAKDWAFLKPDRDTASADRAAKRIRAVADALEGIVLKDHPELVVNVQGDARDPRSFKARIETKVAAAQTPWGDFEQGDIKAHIYPSPQSSDVVASIRLNARAGNTRWGSAEHFRLALDLVQPETITNIISARLKLSAAKASTRWGSLANFSSDVAWLHAVTNPVPVRAWGELACAKLETKWGTAASARLKGSLASTSLAPGLAPPEWGWWTNLVGFAIDAECEAGDVRSPKIQVHRAELAGAWHGPNFELRGLKAELYGGRLEGDAKLDVNSRRVSANAWLNFDVHKASDVMTEGGRRWLGQFSWSTPPEVSATAAATLPSWTNKAPDWRGEVLPTLSLSGRFEGTNGAGYKGLEALSGSSHFIYSNMTWRLPDLVLNRPEGRLVAEHVANDRTRDYYWKLHSTIDPGIIRPLLKTNETRGLDLLELSSPPEIHAEVWGRFHRYDLLCARAHAVGTNLSFRGQSASRVEAQVLYSNKVLTVLHPRVERGEEKAAADAIVADFNARQVYITNAYGNMAPLVIARAIGPKVGRTMEAYVFDRPPQARAYGVVPMKGEQGADLHFDVDGGPFHWWKFNISRISGHVHWKESQLSLENLDADFYSGKARGYAVIDVSEIPGTEFVFSIAGTNVLLQEIAADLSSATNKSEGRLDGTVTVTRANSDDWRSVQGYGQLKFHDGLLWDIPLFGVLSPVLDGIMPGLGSSRASEGVCTYIVTNGVFRTSDLDIRTTTMRLQYRGDVDLALDYQLNAKVEAELLKDMWVVGPLVSTVLWPVSKIFEYKVGGTLGDPQLEPINVIPRLMQIPFYPFRIFKGLGTGNGKPASEPPANPKTAN